MSKTWKWILGILAGLLVIAALVAVPLLVRTCRVNALGGEIRSLSDSGVPLVVNTDGEIVNDWDGPRLYTRSYPMMGGWGHMRSGGMFMGFGMLFAWLFPLALLGALVYGAYRLGRGRQPSAPAPLQACPKCGQPVQPGWKHCADCGRKL